MIILNNDSINADTPYMHLTCQAIMEGGSGDRHTVDADEKNEILVMLDKGFAGTKPYSL